MGHRVLIVEDDAATAALLQHLLEGAGYEVSVVRDGEKALAQVGRERPDVVLLDVTLPTIDGYEVLSRIRRDHRTLMTIVILLTTRAGQSDVALGWLMEPDDYVLKPFDPEDVLARVAIRIKRREAALSFSWALLPGGTAIEAAIRGRIDAGESVALLHVDLDQFKGFNDRYGFGRGNRAIELMARVLQGIANDISGGCFPGHIGGDDFAVIVAPELAEKTAQEILDRFDRAVPALYDPRDRAAGFIEARDRTGARRRYPIMTVSIGIASTASRPYTHYGEITQVASEMKAWRSASLDPPTPSIDARGERAATG